MPNNKAEQQVKALEEEIKQKKLELAKLRKQMPKKQVPDYKLKSLEGEIKLSDFFGNKNSLIVVHNMGKGCEYCTMWADGFNGVLSHLEYKTAFILTTPDSPNIQRTFALGRGWKFRMASTQGTPFAKDLGWEDAKGERNPGISVFEKDKSGKIYLTANLEYGPHDNFCVVYDLFDLLPKSYDDVEAHFDYLKQD